MAARPSAQRLCMRPCAIRASASCVGTLAHRPDPVGPPGFSMVGQGLMRAYLPAAPWRPLIASMGYPIGFLIVILGRQQLVTEITITPILPLCAHPRSRHVRAGGAALGQRTVLGGQPS